MFIIKRINNCLLLLLIEQFFYINSNHKVTRSSFGGVCSADYMCFPNTLLSCVSNTCQCPSGTDWFWSPDYMKCIQCPLGWRIYSGRCYFTGSTSPTSWEGAQSFCTSVGGHLMIVNTQEEYSLLLQFYAASGAGRVWV
jgi:hypothetical protein